MASASNKYQNPSSSSRPPKTPKTHTGLENPNPTINSPDEDLALSRASHLTRQEVLRRRSRKLKQLSKCYRDHYWALMEDLKIQYRDYYWEFGDSPFKQQQQQQQQHDADKEEIEASNVEVEGSGENNNIVNLDMKKSRRCVFVGCSHRPMPLTAFCHRHILSDSNQKLYKPCINVSRSAQATTCGKPILRSTVPSLCTTHFQKTQKHVTMALRKAGLNGSSSSKFAPKFHIIVAEYVREIQVKRRAAKKENRNKIVVKKESVS